MKDFHASGMQDEIAQVVKTLRNSTNGIARQIGVY